MSRTRKTPDPQVSVIACERHTHSSPRLKPGVSWELSRCITERTARARADQNRELAQREREAARETASHARERQRQQEAKNRAVWTAQRDGARDRFLPWTRPGVVERGDRVASSRAWAAAAAWAGQDPRALAARDDLGRRIETAHGADPAAILRSVENPSAPGRVPAGRITMPEAVDLAEANAPFYYRRHSNLRGRLDARPNGAAQQQVWADWQHWAEYGRLPTLSRWEAWAEHTGRGAEFAPDRWRVAGGAVDEHARAAALHRHWDTTATDRAGAELDHHRAQMRAAGLDPNRADLAIGTSLTPAGRPDRPLDPNGLDDAAVADLVRTWEPARVTAILEPDNAATALDNADLLERHFRDRFGIDPATYLADALQDTATAATDAARDQDAVATALSEETAIAHDISASTATGAPVEIRYRDVVLPAGPDNPDRGVAPTKAGSDAEREQTFVGLRAADGQGRHGGRPPAIGPTALGAVRAGYADGRSIASLARENRVSRVAIRTAVADLLPDARADAGDADRLVTLLVPGLIARRLAKHDGLDDAAAGALRRGQQVRRGQGWSQQVTAARDVHQALLDAAAEAVGETPAERKALRIYRGRVSEAAEARP